MSANPYEDGVLLNVPTFKGQNTNAPQGSQPLPELLLNVNLDRTGGWSPMWAKSRRVNAVTAVLNAGVGDDLFVQQGTQVNIWRSQTNTLTALSGGVTTLNNAVLVMPEVLLLNGGATWATSVFTQSAALIPGTVNGFGISDLIWTYVDKTPAPGAVAVFNDTATTETEFAVEWIPTRDHSMSGVTLFKTGLGHGTPPTNYRLRLVVSLAYNQPPHFNVYCRQGTSPFRFIGSNYAPLITGGPLVYKFDIEFSPDLATSAPLPNIGLRFAVTANTATTYHRGRAFISPDSLTYQRVNTTIAEAKVEGATTVTDAVPSRVYFSEVTADGRSNLPSFSLINYFDVPFRVSRRVVGMLGVGPYLYIWGDRELWVMTGDPAYDANLECVGDSIGAISPQSIRQLAGTVYWQSDSGLMAVNGTQVQEVGEPVRDQLNALGLDVTATVDFKREQYMITDGVTVLVYHAREGAWTSRQVEGAGSPALIYGGGTPYMLQGGALYSIGGEAGLDGTPARLPMRVRFPQTELGSWTSRKSFQRVMFGVDLATSSAAVTNDSTVDGRVDGEADTAVTVVAGGDGLCMLHLSRDGAGISGGSIGIEFTVSTQDSRGIIRPPLVLMGSYSGEREYSDYAR